jgi:Skp family chaperone for outer membrane proteins
MINENKKWLVPAAVILGALLLTAGLIWSFSAFSFKIATVDIQKIEADSEFSQKLNEEVQAKGKELSSKFKSAKNDQEKQAINVEFENFKNEKQKEFTSKVKSAIEKVAGKRGYKGVASNQVYIYSAYDITQDVLEELDN